MVAKTPVTSIWEIEPHTQAKHDILRKYLNAWIPKITKYNRRVLFCDGFAGPGVYKNGEDGSPLIAIKTLINHAHFPKINAEIVFLFIEKNRDRLACLEQKINSIELPKNVKCYTFGGFYEKVFGQILNDIESKDIRLAPTLLFVDPFGVSGIPLSLIKRFMNYQKCEVFINIMTSWIARFIETPEFEPHCQELFGCDDWRNAMMLPEEEQRIEALCQLYEARLTNTINGAGAKYVRKFTMKNEHGRRIYDLFFATKSPHGIDAMKDVMWKVDPSGHYSFSDATNPNQEVLFTSTPDWSKLYVRLCQKFHGQKVSWLNVEEEIRCSPFRILRSEIKKEANKPGAKFKIEYPQKRHTIEEGIFDFSE